MKKQKCPDCKSTNITNDKWVVGEGNTMKNDLYEWYCGNCGNLFNLTDHTYWKYGK